MIIISILYPYLAECAWCRESILCFSKEKMPDFESHGICDSCKKMMEGEANV